MTLSCFGGSPTLQNLITTSAAWKLLSKTFALSKMIFSGQNLRVRRWKSSKISEILLDHLGWWQRDINRFIYYNICHMFTCIQKTGMCVIYMPSPSNPIQTHRWKYEQLGVFWITTTWTSWYSDTKNRQTSVTVFDGVAKGELNRPWWITGKFWQTCIYAIYIVEPLLFWDYSSQGGYSMPARCWSSNTEKPSWSRLKAGSKLACTTMNKLHSHISFDRVEKLIVTGAMKQYACI